MREKYREQHFLQFETEIMYHFLRNIFYANVFGPVLYLISIPLFIAVFPSLRLRPSPNSWIPKQRKETLSEMTAERVRVLLKRRACITKTAGSTFVSFNSHKTMLLCRSNTEQLITKTNVYLVIRHASGARGIEEWVCKGTEVMQNATCFG